MASLKEMFGEPKPPAQQRKIVLNILLALALAAILYIQNFVPMARWSTPIMAVFYASIAFVVCRSILMVRQALQAKDGR